MGYDNLQLGMAEFVKALTIEKLSAAIVKDAKFRLLDWIGSALVGTKYRQSRIVSDVVKKSGGLEQATLLRHGVKVPVMQAAFANGVAGHVAEFDDGHRNSISHPGAVTVPTALAVAEAFHKTGKDLITGIVAGYDVMIRLGSTVNPSHYKRWHTTGTCGTFGAVAAASKILNLNERQICMAIGIAGTLSAGSRATFGTDAKPLNAGHACQSGVQAALLARDGFTGPDDIIGGKMGFIKATSQAENVKFLGDINDGAIVSSTAFFKMYASCGHTNSALDIVLALDRENKIAIEQIKEITIYIYKVAVELTGKFKNADENEAKFSLPYCVAVALLYKKVTLAEFGDEVLSSPAVRELAQKIKLQEDSEATMLFPGGRKATVEILTTGGQRFIKTIMAANDRPNYDAVAEKFINLASSCIAGQQAADLKEIVLHIEQVDDVSKVTRFLM